MRPINTASSLRRSDSVFASATSCSNLDLSPSFFPTDNYLLENIDKSRQIPTVIVQGRYDVVCPITSAWDLHRALPEAEFIVVPDCGHSVSEKGITAALVDAMDRFRSRQ